MAVVATILNQLLGVSFAGISVDQGLTLLLAAVVAFYGMKMLGFEIKKK